MNAFAVALGGALGALLRYGVSQWFVNRVQPVVPWHTLAVNITGAFALGVLMTVAAQRELVGHTGRLFLCVGMLGGYTTFSTLAFETVELAQEGMAVHSAAYALGSLLLGVCAVWAGIQVGRYL